MRGMGCNPMVTGRVHCVRDTRTPLNAAVVFDRWLSASRKGRGLPHLFVAVMALPLCTVSRALINSLFVRQQCTQAPRRWREGCKLGAYRSFICAN
jgi:hypothetical protein